ncbi:MAG: hypothetical protein AUJ52_08345 [Elusimicrobia bacterium CG1_02_63_36]|nr:MAG: hypothetical protein AUJ52_08345 [Elusimicrobia bacterium CG1_02_63_36]PIP84691.1 MAG: hypothetical protein COR54_02820 [Elusimicrobia bacterium CG22_combo_CG10-13_8_21_14_all_63_91]PJA13245.1 MAG: hypothetical protein COX66_15435 [Elusimicrobia bacterium CG_4_10_14_0_2_um_filter_63_34]PJB24443.1 MAG: hypothetical protein CO113_13685 [Elusimicrobia bacterium CG_4_9_14_3_um_filter_62_55]
MSDRDPSPWRRATAPALAVFIASVFVSHVCYLLFFNGGWSYEFSHYAEIARRFLATAELRTSTFWPAELAFFHHAGVSIEPDGPLLFRYPLYALWCAFWMALAGVHDYGMVLANIVAFGVWSAAVYLAARLLFGARSAAWTAALWLLMPALQAGYVLGGFVDILFGAEMTILIAAAVAIGRCPELQERKPLAGFGVVLGLTYLTRTNAALWAPIFFALPFVWRWKFPRTLCLSMLGGFAVLVLPWTLYRWSVFGASAPGVLLWNMAEYTIVDGLPWMEYRLYTPWDFLDPVSLCAVLYKGWSLFNRFLSDWPGMWDLQLAMPFAVLGLYTQTGAPRRFASLAGTLLLVELAVMSFLRYQNLGFMGNHHYLWLAPWPLAFAADFLVRRTDRTGYRILAALMLLLQLQFMGWSYLRTSPTVAAHPSGKPLPAWPEIAFMRDRIPPDSRVMTNAPATITWYGGRPSINIPNKLSDVPKITGRWRVDYLLFITHPIGEPQHYPEWTNALRGGLGRPDAVFKGLGFKLLRQSNSAVLFERSL